MVDWKGFKGVRGLLYSLRRYLQASGLLRSPQVVGARIISRAPSVRNPKICWTDAQDLPVQKEAAEALRLRVECAQLGIFSCGPKPSTLNPSAEVPAVQKGPKLAPQALRTISEP